MLRFFQNLRTRFGTAWQASTPGARMAYSLAITAVVVVVGGVGYWSAQPQYVALVQGRPPSDVALIVSQLESAGIAYRLDFAGSTVLVPKHQYNKARVAARDNLSPLGDVANAEVDGGFFADPSLNQHRLLQAKESELEKSLMRNKAISAADVHIAKPIPSPFARERQPASASVVLQIRPDQQFSRQQAASVASMVAGAVEGLQPEAVTITDVHGNILWSDVAQGSGQVMERAEYQRRVEDNLAAKAESLLEQTLGPGKAVVRVTARIDFNNRKTREMTYDAKAKIKKSESTRITSKQTARGSSTAVGPANGASVPAAGGNAASAAAAPLSEKEEETETNYENPHVESEITEAPGTIQRLTVAVMVDLSTTPAADNPTAASGATLTASSVTQEQVMKIVKSAVGFDPERSDQIEVVVAQLKGIDSEPLVVAIPWQEYGLLVRNGSLGIAALVAFTLGVMLIRTFSQALNRLPERTAGKPDAMRDFAAQAQRDPEVVAKILSAWLSRSEPDAGTPSTIPFDAAARGQSAGSQRAA